MLSLHNKSSILKWFKILLIRYASTFFLYLWFLCPSFVEVGDTVLDTRKAALFVTNIWSQYYFYILMWSISEVFEKNLFRPHDSLVFNTFCSWHLTCKHQDTITLFVNWIIFSSTLSHVQILSYNACLI